MQRGQSKQETVSLQAAPLPWATRVQFKVSTALIAASEKQDINGVQQAADRPRRATRRLYSRDAPTQRHSPDEK